MGTATETTTLPANKTTNGLPCAQLPRLVGELICFAAFREWLLKTAKLDDADITKELTDRGYDLSSGTEEYLVAFIKSWRKAGIELNVTPDRMFQMDPYHTLPDPKGRDSGYRVLLKQAVKVNPIVSSFETAEYLLLSMIGNGRPICPNGYPCPKE